MKTCSAVVHLGSGLYCMYNWRFISLAPLSSSPQVLVSVIGIAQAFGLFPVQLAGYFISSCSKRYDESLDRVYLLPKLPSHPQNF